MNPEKITELKAILGRILEANDMNPNSASGRLAVASFWQGVMAVSGEAITIIVVLLMAGRHDELVTMP